MSKHTPPLVLIIDDEPYFLEIFSVKLRSLGLTVEVAHGADQGIAQAVALDPDLILMDVQMPGKNGIEAMLALKENEKTKHLKIVFLTSLGDVKVESQQTNDQYAKSTGADGYLKKTDDIEMLGEKVMAFLK